MRDELWSVVHSDVDGHLMLCHYSVKDTNDSYSRDGAVDQAC